MLLAYHWVTFNDALQKDPAVAVEQDVSYELLQGTIRQKKSLHTPVNSEIIALVSDSYDYFT